MSTVPLLERCANLAPALLIQPPAVEQAAVQLREISNGMRWSWACRVLKQPAPDLISRENARAPKAGDLAVVQVTELGCHERITTRENMRLRIYAGDYLACVFGNRYATDAYEGLVEDVENLSLLTAGGMIGTVRSRHRSTGRPTNVRFVGYLGGANGEILNLKRLAFKPKNPGMTPANLIAVVGTGMNAGKTTSCVRLIKGLSDLGLRVAACKLTGSVSNRDQDEMRAASAVRVLDFSDYGFPSTYLCPKTELMSLFRTMMADIAPSAPDVVVMEIADGILQRETAMLLEEARIRTALQGVVLAADNALSAHFGVQRLHSLGHDVLGVTGLLTSSPLCVREFNELSDVPVASSAGSGSPLAELVTARLAQPPARRGR
jgi:hypothetical protein